LTSHRALSTIRAIGPPTEPSWSRHDDTGVPASLAPLASALVGHNPIALVPDPRDLDDILATIRKVRPAAFGGVPTLFIALLNHPAVKSGKVDLRSIRPCVSGAASLLSEVKQRFEARTGGKIVEGLSLTEAMLALIANPVDGANKPGSIGVPLPKTTIGKVLRRALREEEAGRAPTA